MKLGNQNCEIRFYFCLYFCILVILTGCERKSVDPEQYETMHIDINDVVGTWQITNDSIQHLKAEGYSIHIQEKDYLLRLSKDGKCSIRTYESFPPQPSKEEQESLYLKDMEGNWNIERNIAYIKHEPIKVSVVKVNIQTIDSSKLNNIYITNKTVYYYINKKDENYELWNFIGDPDYRNFITFKKLGEG